MSLLDRLNDDLKQAMRSGDQTRKLTLRAVKTAIRQTEVAGEEARTLTDQEILAVIAKQAKQRRDSIAEYEKGGRLDLVEEEQAELAVIRQEEDAVRVGHRCLDVVELVSETTDVEVNRADAHALLQ